MSEPTRREREARLAERLGAAHRRVASAQEEVQTAKTELLDAIIAAREERVPASEIGAILGTGSSRTYALIKEADERQARLVGASP